MRKPRQPITEAWLLTLPSHVRADFETGQLYWRHPGKGKILTRPIGCLDSNGYIKVTIDYVNTYAHSVIFFLYNGYWAPLIDHENRIRNDNRPSNLIDSNHSANAMNSGLFSTNTTGRRGVSYCSRTQKYKVTKQSKHLGYFDKLEDAGRAYENG